MRFLLIFLVFMFVTLPFMGCKKEETPKTDSVSSTHFEPDFNPNDPDEAEFQERLASTPDLEFTSSQILLPNGKTIPQFEEELGMSVEEYIKTIKKTSSPAEELNAIIGAMQRAGEKYVNRDNFDYTANGKDECSQQYGLGYRWGGKDLNCGLHSECIEYDENKKCIKPTPCKEKLVGLDCSGLIHLIARDAGLDIRNEWKLPGNVKHQKKASVWADAFKAKGADVDVKEVKWDNKLDQLQSGDVICWNGHIGIILKLVNGKLGCFQSNGEPSDLCAELKCSTKNIANGGKGCRRGPRTISLEAISNFRGKPPLHYLRFTPKSDPSDLGPYANKTWVITISTSSDNVNYYPLLNKERFEPNVQTVKNNDAKNTAELIRINKKISQGGDYFVDLSIIYDKKTKNYSVAEYNQYTVGGDFIAYWRFEPDPTKMVAAWWGSAGTHTYANITFTIE